MIARLNITLDDVRPSVVRRIEVSLAIRLDQLHLVFQAVMGWQNEHLYAFWPGRAYQAGSIWYGNSDPQPDNLPASEITLASFMALIPKKTFVYLYDFGDDWHHTVRIASVGDQAVNAIYPRLLSATGRCPPEDIGGPAGFADYLEALADPQHKRHGEMLALHGQFDPNFVDTAAIETHLREMFPFGL